MKGLLSPFLVAIIAFSYCNSSKIETSIVNSEVKRIIDITTHLPKITTTVKIENKGGASVNSYLYAVEDLLSPYVAYFNALIRSGEQETHLDVSKTTVSSHSGVTFYEIKLSSPLSPNDHVILNIETVFSHSIEPYPSEISQAEKQLVRYTSSNIYYYTPYDTTTQSTVINCASSTIESYTKSVKPVSVSENTISYGPYENVAAFAQGELSIHYENNSPFLTITNMERVIEVSHWGNIAIEETIDVIHSGAVLKGSFSRYDYQRSQDGAASIKSFKTVLPASARDVYYRDEIGNISTSAMRELDDMVELELRPRFPLFGGWKTHYVLGYNVPSYQYLYQKGDQFALKMRFIDHVYDDQIIDQLTVKVILPEGVSSIKLDTPYTVKRSADEYHSTYLDTSGRTVIVMHKDNLVEQHIQDFQIEYRFQKVMLIREPLLVVGAFYLLFLIVIVYVRLDFSITKDEKSEARARAASLMEQVVDTQDRRSALYQSYDDAINKYKANKDNSSFVTQRKRIDGDHKPLTQAIQNIYANIKTDAIDVAEKVQELQKLDSHIREQIHQAVALAEKLVNGKITKQQYLESEGSIVERRSELCRKLDDLLATL